MKWGIREAVNVFFKAKSTLRLGARTIRRGEPVLIFDSVKTGTFEVASEVTYVTGGRGNARLMSYEGDKTLTFNFEEALLSNEGLAILSGADLIPSRNSNLPGSSPEARSVKAHYSENYPIITNNIIDGKWGGIKVGTTINDTILAPDPSNTYPSDSSLYPSGVTSGAYPPRGGLLNVWLTRKPYVGQNADIYVLLLDDWGEMTGSPVQINLDNDGPIILANPTGANNTNPGYANKKTYYAKFSIANNTTTTSEERGFFIAFDKNNQPMPVENSITGLHFPLPSNAKEWQHPTTASDKATFDDQVAYYVSVTNFLTTDGLALLKALGPTTQVTLPTNSDASKGTIPMSTDTEANANINFDNWVRSYGNINCYIRHITGSYVSVTTADTGTNRYGYLLKPSGGHAQPMAFKEGAGFFYKVNVPSILYQDTVLIDYYVEYQHNATQVSILPDKFAPYMYVEGSSLVRRVSDGMDLPCEFVIPKFKVTTALTFTLTSTGDASTFNFSGDAYPDYSKFDLTRKVLADIQILDADDNYGSEEINDGDPTSYRRYKNAENDDGEYLWKDPSIEEHQNINAADTTNWTIYTDTSKNQNTLYEQNHGGPESITPGAGVIDTTP